MGLCNRYCCVGRAGRWLGGAGAEWEERVRADPGGFRVGVVAFLGDGRARAGCSDASPSVSVKFTLTGRKLPSEKVLTSSPADRTHKREQVRSWLTHRLRADRSALAREGRGRAG